MNTINMREWSPIVLRIGLGLVMVWFGSSQLSAPSSWLVYLPGWVDSLPLSQMNFVFLNGLFEVVFGVALIAGFYTRIVALLLALHLLGIVITVGYNEIGVRDFGLMAGLFSIFLHGPSGWSADNLNS